MQKTTQVRKRSEKQTFRDVKMFAKIKLQVLFAGSATLAKHQKNLLILAYFLGSLE